MRQAHKTILVFGQKITLIEQKWLKILEKYRSELDLAESEKIEDFCLIGLMTHLIQEKFPSLTIVETNDTPCLSFDITELQNATQKKIIDLFQNLDMNQYQTALEFLEEAFVEPTLFIKVHSS